MTYFTSSILGLGAATLLAHALLMRWRQALRHCGSNVAVPQPAKLRPLISPTFLFVYTLVLAALLEAWLPLAGPPNNPVIGLTIGPAIVVVAEILMRRASAELKRHATPEDSSQAAAAIVSKGPFARSRNPIYAGMMLLFVGVVVAAHSAWGLILLPVLFVVLHHVVVRREEQMLLLQFGEVYRSYLSRVPRYL